MTHKYNIEEKKHLMSPLSFPHITSHHNPSNSTLLELMGKEKDIHKFYKQVEHTSEPKKFIYHNSPYKYTKPKGLKGG